jgi:transcription antitermination protein NusB
VSTSPAPDPHPPGPGERRRARERALDLLYESETKSITPAAVLDELVADPDPFASELVRGVDAHLGEIDSLISKHAEGWRLERLPSVDRQLMRIATYELLARLEVSEAVVIDEAVELAKQFSTAESSAYVNGVLAAIAAEVRE